MVIAAFAFMRVMLFFLIVIVAMITVAQIALAAIVNDFFLTAQ